MEKLSAKPERNSNIELFRVVCMAAMVIYHFIMITCTTDMLSSSAPGSLISFMQIFGRAGLYGFMIISGYFMCSSKAQGKAVIAKLLRLWGSVMFYSLLFLGTAYIFGLEPDPSVIKKSLMPVSQVHYWYISFYFLLLILSPFLNVFIRNLEKTGLLKLLAILVTVYLILPTFFSVWIAFSNMAVMIMLYLTGAYIKLYAPKDKPKKHFFAAGSTALFCFVLIFASNHLYNRFGINALSGMPERLMSNASFFMFIIALEAFLGFVALPMRNSRIINTLGGLTFGVYLFHANAIAVTLYDVVFKTYEFYGKAFIVIYIILASCAIYLFASLIDYLRLKLLEPLWIKLIDRLIIPAGEKLFAFFYSYKLKTADKKR